LYRRLQSLIQLGCCQQCCFSFCFDLVLE
jgi:hypothetical protein